MECSEKEEFGMFGSMFFFGCVCSSFILPRMSDFYGRKPVALLGNVLHVIAGFIILLISKDMVLTYFLVFI